MTVTKPKSTPKTKSGKTNQRAILAEPVKHEGPLPEKKRTGRKSTLAPIVAKLKADPGEWYRIGSGKTGTIYQMGARLRKNFPELLVQTGVREDDNTQADCFAKMPLQEDAAAE